MTRRQLLSMIGVSAGSAAMYQAMTSLGFAADSSYKGPAQLSGAPAGSSVLVLGAGIAGLVAAYELRKAGYRVQVLEYNNRPGGRNWTLRGGDRYTELGGYTQECKFDPGLYINPGPWRLPYHHKGMLSYCKLLGVKLEPFMQTNFNAYLHSTKAFGGKPQRFRHIKADYHGHVAELLAKFSHNKKLDGGVTAEDQERLMVSLRAWGALDKNFTYVKGPNSSDRRGFEKDPGGGLSGRPTYSEPIGLSDLLASGLWEGLPICDLYDMQTAIFQPVGGMGMVGQAFARELGAIIRYNAKVVQIDQDERGVSVSFEDTAAPSSHQTAHADWCVCTIPLSILGSNPHEGEYPNGAGDSRVSVRRIRQGRLAVQTPFLGRGRADLRRHHLYRPAHQHHLLSQRRHLRDRKGGAPRRISIRSGRLGVHRHESGRAGCQGGGIWNSNSSPIPPRVRERYLGRLASIALHHGLLRHLE